MDEVQAAVKKATQVLAVRPSALITDIDGTISRIVSRPEDAVVTERVQQALGILVGEVALVAVVTAREETVARQMVGVPELIYVGNYALDMVDGPADEGRLAATKEAVRPLLADLPCLSLEEKGLTFALHYRNCEEPDVRERLLQAVTPIAAATGAKVLEGKQVIELVPADHPDKGNALTKLLDRHGVQGVVYLGDDLSDLPVFRAVAQRRREGLPGLGIAVIDEETDAAVAAAADLHLQGVDAVEEFISRLAETLEGDKA
jgi:trehalose 6-phosphate phosphatase